MLVRLLVLAGGVFGGHDEVRQLRRRLAGETVEVAFGKGAGQLARAVLAHRWPTAIAAVLLATFPPHLHFSRVGIIEIADPFIGVLGFALLAQAFRTQRRLEYVAANRDRAVVICVNNALKPMLERKGRKAKAYYKARAERETG